MPFFSGYSLRVGEIDYRKPRSTFAGRRRSCVAPVRHRAHNLQQPVVPEPAKLIYNFVSSAGRTNPTLIPTRGYRLSA